MVMTYILMMWAIVAPMGTAGNLVYDWRPVGEFHRDTWKREISAEDMCKNAAKELQLKKYVCLRNS